VDEDEFLNFSLAKFLREQKVIQMELEGELEPEK
jgi:hypothetical protein